MWPRVSNNRRTGIGWSRINEICQEEDNPHGTLVHEIGHLRPSIDGFPRLTRRQLLSLIPVASIQALMLPPLAQQLRAGIGTHDDECLIGCLRDCGWRQRLHLGSEHPSTFSA